MAPLAWGLVTDTLEPRRKCHRAAKRPAAALSKEPGVRCRLPQRPHGGVAGALPHGRAPCARSHADERVSPGEAVRTRTLHGFACAALALACAREGEFARGPARTLKTKTPFMYMIITPFQRALRTASRRLMPKCRYILAVWYIPGMCRHTPMMIFLYQVLPQS